MTENAALKTRTYTVTVAAKLVAFTVALVALFGGGALLGGLIDPGAPGDQDAAAQGHGGPAGAHAPAHGTTSTAEDHAGAGKAAVQAVRGLAVAENGLRLVIDTPEIRRGQTTTLRFRILDEAGRTVRDFDVEHTKRLHLIVVRRDMTGFRHLHPAQDQDGAWTTPIRVGTPGSYRVLADFSHGGRLTTLAADLRADGDADLQPLPAPASSATSDRGYRVRVSSGPVTAGDEAQLRYVVRKDGRPVTTEPFLGARGHLVALREGDLAFLHVHPVSSGAADAVVRFASTFPSAGRYRLYLQFQHEGRVHTVAFTQEVSR